MIRRDAYAYGTEYIQLELFGFFETALFDVNFDLNLDKCRFPV